MGADLEKVTGNTVLYLASKSLSHSKSWARRVELNRSRSSLTHPAPDSTPGQLTIGTWIPVPKRGIHLRDNPRWCSREDGNAGSGRCCFLLGLGPESSRHVDFEGLENLLEPDVVAKRMNPALPQEARIAAGRLESFRNGDQSQRSVPRLCFH